MKAFLIARVSTEDQEDALPAQIYRLNDYAIRNDYDRELYQLQESAFKEGRKLFGEIVEKIEQHQGNSIVVFDKIDRYSRDSGSTETRRLRRLCLDGKIEIHFASDILVLNSKSSANSWFMLGMGEATAEYYSRSVSDNVRRRFEQKRRDGEWTGNAPFGYKNVTLPNTKKWVEKNPLQARAVKSAYEWYATGNYSLILLREKLLKEYGVILSNSQMQRVLSNPFYKGEMQIQGKLYPHKYDRVVSEDLYDQVLDIREGRVKKPTRYAGLPYPYRGLVKCGECGCVVTFEKKKGKYIYGHCTQYKGKHGAGYIPQDDFTLQLKKAFESFEMPEEDYLMLREKLLESYEQDNKTDKDNLSHVEAEIKKYTSRLDRLYEDHTDGLIPDDFYERKFEEYTKLKKNLERKKATFELSDNSRFEQSSYLLNLIKNAPTIFKMADIEHKRSILNLALSNLELNDDLLRWELKEPFYSASKCKENSNWLSIQVWYDLQG